MRNYFLNVCHKGLYFFIFKSCLTFYRRFTVIWFVNKSKFFTLFINFVLKCTFSLNKNTKFLLNRLFQLDEHVYSNIKVENVNRLFDLRLVLITN